jgi:hypothetical protein
MKSVRNRWTIEVLIILLLFSVALLVRLYRLQDFPPGLYTDEAANGVDARSILDGQFSVFFPRNTGREPMLIYLQAAAIGLLGATPYALRVVPAIAGALTVPAVYWMTRQAFSAVALPARWMGLWTALFVTFSYWHVSMSRLGFRAILLPLLSAVAFAFFWQAWNRWREHRDMPWLNLALCGISTGLALYTYTAARLVPVWLALTFWAGAIPLWRTVGWKQLSAGFALIAGSALLVFVPLGIHFLNHPDQFYGRAMDVSVFNAYFAGDSPGQALWDSVSETARMFGDRSDPNLRHNPAGRPVFEVWMTAWLSAGVIISIWRIRIPPYLFALTGFIIFAIPAVITAEGLPHSLRAFGMSTSAYLLSVTAMMVVGKWLATRFRLAAHWTPLPFLLLSACFGMHSYFGAWQELERFRGPFLSDFTEIDMSQDGDVDGIWLWPLSPNYHWADDAFYPLEFLHQGDAGYGSVWLNSETISASLQELTEGRRSAYLVRTQEMDDVANAAFIMGDPKHLLEFVLEKHGKRVAVFDTDETRSHIPYTQYALPEQSDYAVYEEWIPTDLVFADRLRLNGYDRGEAIIELDDARANRSIDHVTSGERLWVVLNWEALAPIDVDLKTSLVLRDVEGNLAGQVDDLLVGDQYPVERIWAEGERSTTYHILPVWPGVLPGAYTLGLQVYEEQSQQSYPLTDDKGSPLGTEAVLGKIQIEPALRPQEITPSIVLSDNFRVGESLRLIGGDLPERKVAPGQELPFTLYWQAEAAPLENLAVTIRLIDESGQTAVETTMKTGSAGYPSSQWREGDVMRDWKKLSIPQTLPFGTYDLVLTETDTTATPSIKLSTINIQGRVRLFEPPELLFEQDAQVGHELRLLGIHDYSPEPRVEPGQTLNFDLIWQVVDRPAAGLVRFTHLLDENGMLAAQQDTVPCDGECPSSSWTENEVLSDSVSLQIPSDLAPGAYTLAVGWYEAETFRRRPVTDSEGRQQANGAMSLPILVHVE